MIAFCACFFLPVLAQLPKETKPRQIEESAAQTTPSNPPHELTRSDVAAFLDGIVPIQLQRENIAGAVVAVVKDGQIFFEKGYGEADVDKKVPVSATDTLFRPGSVSKLFTWTAVMQLVEQGKLDLDRNVNDYLEFKIPDTYAQPITLRHLMTHTPGFEENDKDLIFTRTSDLEPLGRFMATRVPRRIFPPGAVPAYSNYGAALAGYIVQRVSGRPFEEYVDEFIFKPLRMPHSTFAQPLPPSLQPLMSKGYDLASDPPKDFELVGLSPAGSMSASADDIAHFMIAHLQDGRYGDAQILRPETAHLMHARQRVSNPQTNGMALGFYEESRNGLRIIGHGGDTQWFHSDLHLVPGVNLGFFVSYNSAGKGEAGPRGMLWHQFLDRYFSYQPPAPVPVPNAAADAKAISGEYLTSRRCDSCVLRIGYLLSEAKVSSQPDGTITVDLTKYPSGQPRKWREIAPFLYRDVNGQEEIAFNQLGKGGFEMVYPVNVFVFDRVVWYEGKTFALIVMIGTATVLFLTLLLWPVAALTRRHYQRKLELDRSGQILRVAVRIVCAIDLLVLVAWSVFFAQGFEDLSVFSHRNDGWLHALQVVSILGVVGTVFPLYSTLRAWSRAIAWWWERTASTLIFLACVGYVWIVLTGRFLDWSLRY